MSGWWRCLGKPAHNLLAVGLLALCALPGHAEMPWSETGADGEPVLQIYFFRSLACPYCNAARPEVAAIVRQRPWLRLHDLEITEHPENVALYQTMAHDLGREAASVPALLFCGEMQLGWGEGASEHLAQRLDACHAR